jgi:PIN domain nuclease of toxin-antitoxin system
MKNKTKEIIFITKCMAIVLFMASIIWYWSKPNEAVLPKTKVYSSKTLDPERQIVWIRVDSLKTLLNEIPKGRISWEEKSNNLIFNAIDQEEFNRILLDNAYLSTFKQLDNPVITVEENGFSAIIETKSDIRYVQLPAEIVYSLLLNLRK